MIFFCNLPCFIPDKGCQIWSETGQSHPPKSAGKDVKVVHLFWSVTDVFVWLDRCEMLSMRLLLNGQMCVFFSRVGVATVCLDSLLFMLWSTPEALFGQYWSTVSLAHSHPVSLRSSLHFSLTHVASPSLCHPLSHLVKSSQKASDQHASSCI